MPYPKRYNKKRVYKKRAYKKKSLAKKVYRLEKKMAGESKCVDNVINNVVVDDYGGIVHLTGIAQGDGLIYRDGNQIAVRGIYGRLNWDCAGAEQCRLIIFQDTQQVADSAPTVTDVILGANTQIYSFLNPNTVGRFKILYDKTYVVPPMASDVNGVKVDNFILKRWLNVRYNGSGSNDIQKGGIYMIAISNDITGTDRVHLNGLIRVRYQDN